MSRKSLKGLVKTRHFKERQRERKISDKEVLKVIYEGELRETDHGQSFVLGDLKVTVDNALEILITVLPKDPSLKPMKLITKEDARKLQRLIEAHRKEKEELNKDEGDEFMKFIAENKITKLKK